MANPERDNYVPEEQPHLTFVSLRLANKLRFAEQVFHHTTEWDAAKWMLALVGEVGELANMLKKRNRGEVIPDLEIQREIADINIYLDLLADHLGVTLDEAIIEKFNTKSRQVGSDITLSHASVEVNKGG